MWHCPRLKTLAAVARLANLETLVIASYPDATSLPLSGLARLRHLRILHLPKVTDLAPLAEARALETASLETVSSWDASGKMTVIRSLDPIASLPHLAHLQLHGVRPADRNLAPLERGRALRSVHFHSYPGAEVQRFLQQTGLREARPPQPEWDPHGP